ncbi:MAG: hypothetical protein GX648_06470 [Crenarchaeota archaeon]|nr:hypothetical protein [Thermoproteota archaeon]
MRRKHFSSGEREVFCVSQLRRTYDRATGKFRFEVSYETHTEVTPRTLVVAEAFGQEIQIDYYPNTSAKECSLSRSWQWGLAKSLLMI